MADTYSTFVLGSELTAGNGGYSTLVSTMATLSTAIGVLVADGASPTQAHVTTANTALTAVNAALSAISGATQAALLVNVDTTRVPTVSVLRTLLNQVLVNAAASGMAP